MELTCSVTFVKGAPSAGKTTLIGEIKAVAGDQSLSSLQSLASHIDELPNNVASFSAPNAGAIDYNQSPVSLDITRYLPGIESNHPPEVIAKAHLKAGDYEQAINIWNDHG